MTNGCNKLDGNFSIESYLYSTIIAFARIEQAMSLAELAAIPFHRQTRQMMI
jgi:hypothetical protein